MILYSNKEVSLMQQNIIVLYDTRKETKEEGQEVEVDYGTIAVSHDVYETAIVLKERYIGKRELVERLVPEKTHEEAAEYFYKTAPKPINILASFLHLVDPSVEIPLDLRTMCGYLHIITNAISFTAYVEAPHEIRKAVKFDNRILDKFEGEWDSLKLKVKFAEVDEPVLKQDFVKSLIKQVCDEVLLVVPQRVPVGFEPTMPMMYSQPAMPKSGPGYYPTDEEEAEEEKDSGDIWGSLDDIVAGLLEEEPEPEPEPEPEEEPVVEEEATKESEKEKSALEKVIALYGGN